MSQKTIILLFAALILFIASGFILAWYFLFAGNTSTSEEGDGPGFFDFLNYDGTSNPIPTPEEEEEPIAEVPQNTEPPRLRLLSREPSSAVIATTTSEGLVARIIDRADGNIFDIPLENEGEKVRRSNTTLLRIQEAYWLPGANDIVIRFLDEELENIDTYLGQLNKRTGTTTSSEDHFLDGSYLDVSAGNMAIPKAGSLIAYTADTPAGTGIYTSRPNGTSKTLIHVSPLKQWLLQWVKGDTIALTTAPSGIAPGFMYYLNVKGGEPERIIPGTFGLTTLASPTGERVLFSESVTNSLKTYSYNRTSRVTTLLPVATLPEKCVWSARDASIAYCGVPDALPATTYPDAWYMGAVQFKDHIWRVDASNGGATLLEIPGGEAANGIDMVDLSLSRDENYLVFRNRTDDSIWSYTLEGI